MEAFVHELVAQCPNAAVVQLVADVHAYKAGRLEEVHIAQAPFLRPSSTTS